MKDCDYCNGRGEVVIGRQCFDYSRPAEITEKCFKCSGSGKIGEDKE